MCAHARACVRRGSIVRLPGYFGRHEVKVRFPHGAWASFCVAAPKHRGVMGARRRDGGAAGKKEELTGYRDEDGKLPGSSLFGK